MCSVALIWNSSKIWGRGKVGPILEDFLIEAARRGPKRGEREGGGGGPLKTLIGLFSHLQPFHITPRQSEDFDKHDFFFIYLGH